MTRKRQRGNYGSRIRRRNIKSRFKISALLMKLSLSVVILSGLTWFLWYNCLSFFKTSDFFNVSRIELAMKPFLKDAMELSFYNVSNQSNIFCLVPDAISANLIKKHPEFKSVIISRKPPNVMSVRINYKKPVAFIKLKTRHKFFYNKDEVFYRQRGGCTFIPIACDGVVLPPNIETDINLTAFIGIDFNISVVKVGMACSDKRLLYGIRFLNIIKSYWSGGPEKIELIDISDTKNISMFLTNGIEIKMPDSGGSIMAAAKQVKLREKLALLKGILENPKFDFKKIKYIDLRFSDVIIGAKTEGGA